LEVRVEELMAFLDRSKRFGKDDAEAAVNMEYLKNCVFRYMASSEHSERRRLCPVLCTLLKLTAPERRTVEDALTAAEKAEAGAADPLGSLGLGNVLASTGLDSFFGMSFSSTSNTSATPSTTSSSGQGSGARTYGQGQPIPQSLIGQIPPGPPRR
jgi:hypothetical protein